MCTFSQIIRIAHVFSPIAKKRTFQLLDLHPGLLPTDAVFRFLLDLLFFHAYVLFWPFLKLYVIYYWPFFKHPCYDLASLDFLRLLICKIAETLHTASGFVYQISQGKQLLWRYKICYTDWGWSDCNFLLVHISDCLECALEVLEASRVEKEEKFQNWPYLYSPQ